MKKQLATLLLVGFSGVVFAQGAQQPPSQGGAQPRQQQQPTQQPGAAQQPRQQQGAQTGAVASFETADKNKDGQLSRAEAGDLADFDFSKADVNQNASIDRQEYTAAMASDSSAPKSTTPQPAR